MEKNLESCVWSIKVENIPKFGYLKCYYCSGNETTCKGYLKAHDYIMITRLYEGMKKHDRSQL